MKIKGAIAAKRVMESRLLRAGLVVENTSRQLVAEKSGNLEEGLGTSRVRKEGSRLVVDVGVKDVPYAPFVEKGVSGKTFNYRRRGRVVYRGIGQEFLARSVALNEENITQILAGK